jgi:hypothetical protein
MQLTAFLNEPGSMGHLSVASSNIDEKRGRRHKPSSRGARTIFNGGLLMELVGFGLPFR